ncbi:hypothetical protein CCMSSC00406_0005940 [Pleurotus cornucopiae]|uniref:Uncharacterized protein n=1 Tax=Pleurotus cornucopiae TaxID=5321 RepID=A0ACB7IKN1_PLECO|nr:hypothetical protein CCMSSC00406_0005940 [Pleurotus cornucopiae]
MPRFDGPYKIIHANPERSSYTLDMPNAPNTFPTFHSSLLRRFIPNDPDLFPTRELERPGAISVDGEEEWLVERIINERKGRRGMEYLVRYCGYGSDEDRWLGRVDVEELAAFNDWLAVRPSTECRAKKKRVMAALLEILDCNLDSEIFLS